MVTGFPFVSVQKVICLLLAKSQKVLDTACKIEKIREIKDILHAEGVCTEEFLLRKPGFLLSAMHSHAFRWFSAAPLVFLFLGLLPLQLYQIWRIFCIKYGEECEWILLVVVAKTISH